jgi:CRISPR-associated protein Csm5
MVGTPELSLTKPKVYESKQILLTSPILHIGSAVSQLYPFEYVATSKRVYLPNSDALARTMKTRGRLQDYLQKVENREDITPLLKDVLGEDWRSAKDVEGNFIFPKHTSSLRWTERPITDLRPMIRNGLGQLYIPGSSIKGAIRTAIAYHLLKHGDRYGVPKESRVSEIEQQLRQKMGSLRQKAKFADDSLFMDQLFTDFDLIDPDQPFNPQNYRKGPNTDFMRAVQVTDTEPLLEEKVERQGRTFYSNRPVVAEVIVSSRFPDYRAKYRASIYAEMVRNVRTHFTISLDTEMLSWFHHSQGMKIPFQSLEDILNICKEFAQDQWDGEHDYWLDIQNNPNAAGKNLNFGEIRTLYEPEQCPHSLRIGWASGMPGTTINLLFKDELREEIRDTCGIKAPGFEAPKSRRTIVASDGEIKYVPGWVKFKVL